MPAGPSAGPETIRTSSRAAGPPASGTWSSAAWRIDCGESTLSAAVSGITGAEGVVGRPAGGM
jgi:hypothetical protein